MKFKILSLLAAATIGLSGSLSATLFTWTGANAQLDAEGNWSPAGGPPSAFGPDDALFNASGVTKSGLTPNGTIFSVENLTFSGATYSFAASGLGDGINIGTGASGGVGILAAASVNFSDQFITLNNSMDWNISGNSSFTGGQINSANLTLDINFGVAETNTARFGSLALGGTGSLLVTNWGGTAGVYAGANNQLRFTNDPTSFLNQITFVGYAGSTAEASFNGTYYEVIAVPEPTAMALLAGSLTAVMVLRRRRNS